MTIQRHFSTGSIVKGDPTYIPDKDKYFINIAKAIAKGSNHPKSPGGCIVVRGREILGDGRSVLASCKVEIDCITYAIGVASKRGTGLSGSVIYTTRYPFSAAIFQLHLMGIKKVIVLAHEWESYYKEEFRRAAKLARELLISIEPYYENQDPRTSKSEQSEKGSAKEKRKPPKEAFSGNPIEDDDFDIEEFTTEDDESNFNI